MKFCDILRQRCEMEREYLSEISSKKPVKTDLKKKNLNRVVQKYVRGVLGYKFDYLRAQCHSIFLIRHIVRACTDRQTYSQTLCLIKIILFINKINYTRSAFLCSFFICISY